MTKVLIRQAGDEDRAAVVRLRREWTAERLGDRTDPTFEERLTAWLARERSRRIIWLALADDRPVGMINLAIFERMPQPGRPASHWGYLGNAFVLAGYRNQGIGSRLVSALLGYADENGFARVVLSPSQRSIPFYQRAGFGPANGLMLRTPTRQPGST